MMQSVASGHGMTRVARRRLTADEYERMGAAGILGPDERLELIEGEIVRMSPIGSRHAACVKRLNAALTRLLGERAVVGIQDPVRLGPYWEPEPDGAVLRRREDYYATGHPSPADVLLLVEVADDSLAYDRDVKLPEYARCGIPEAWLVDVNAECIVQYTQPGPGGYGQTREWRRGETLTATGVDGLALRVEQILG
jgi:Uma2 family endonuclease